MYGAALLVFLIALSHEVAISAPALDPMARPAAPPGEFISSNSSSLVPPPRETAGPDTFVLYGGPDHPTEGKFQLADRQTTDWGGGNGLPGGYGGGPDAWKPVDSTKLGAYWHVDTFNAENLNSNGPGNRAMWSGVAAGEPEAEAWVTPPGYGNNWYDILIYESAPLASPTEGQVVSLDFYFNHDTELGFDFFQVQYDSAGTWKTVLSIDGSNKDASNVFQPPGVQFSAVQAADIQYNGLDFGGDNGDQIRIRFLVSSDGAWSDEDGQWPTNGGAAQVDDISLTTSQGTFTEDFEGAGPYLFERFVGPFAGDFADVYTWLSDPDPCRSHYSPVLGFIDYGQRVRNGPGHTGATSTGGSTSPGVFYGINGNFVVNYSGGLSFGEVSLRNFVESPEISWDLPGTGDDDPAIAGAAFRLSMFADMPLFNGITWIWHVRSALPGEAPSTWADRDSGFNPIATSTWIRYEHDVSDLVQPGAEFVQLRLGCWDAADLFGFPGNAATPSPVYDDVSFYKYRMQGPNLWTVDSSLAQDGFPNSGSIDASTQSSRDALDVPFSMARDVNTGDRFNVPGDSVIVDAWATISGTEVVGLDMVWALDTNPLFEDAIRAAPGRPVDHDVVAGSAGTIWSGEVTATNSTAPSGAPILGRYYFDLPDEDLIYPGDVLHYYIRAIDSDGRTSTLPSDVSGFGNFVSPSAYDRRFTVRALPSIADAAGSQPNLIVVNHARQPDGEAEFVSSFSQLGYHEGVDYDTYTVRGAFYPISNGIGSAGAHGANAQQLAGYRHLFSFAGDLRTGVISNGSGVGYNDKSNDVAVLEQWHALVGQRNAAWFGDNLAYALTNDSAEARSFLNSMLGVFFDDDSVHDAIGDQDVPRVSPSTSGATWFSGDYVAYGGCYALPRFDQIRPIGGSEPGHVFLDPTGQPITNPDNGVASVIQPLVDGVCITFPYSISNIYPVIGRETGPGARTLLFSEVLGLFNAGPGAGPPIPAPRHQRVGLSVVPNPCNPTTIVTFTTPLGSKGSVKVFNLRGELVRTLHNGEFSTQEFRWNGSDSRGAPVGSGVYLIRAVSGTEIHTKKVALVK